jgi:hypothetical protein
MTHNARLSVYSAVASGAARIQRIAKAARPSSALQGQRHARVRIDCASARATIAMRIMSLLRSSAL